MTRTKKYWFTIKKRENGFSNNRLVVVFASCKKKAIEKLKREYKTDSFIYDGFTHL